MRGRKPHPTALRRLRGNPGKRRLNTAEPEPPPLFETPDTPETLPRELASDRRAADLWRELVPILRDARQITQADRMCLVALCIEWSTYLQAHARVRKSGTVATLSNGVRAPNPYLSIRSKSLAALTKLWAELGLTPASRSRLVTVAGGPGPGGDAFSEFDEPLPPRAH